MEVRPGQEGLIGEHLLEVRDQPASIGRVAAEPAHQMVVDASGRHGVECAHRHLPRPPPRPGPCGGTGGGTAQPGSDVGTLGRDRSHPTAGRIPRPIPRRRGPATGRDRAQSSLAGTCSSGPAPPSSAKDSARRISLRTASARASACSLHLIPVVHPGLTERLHDTAKRGHAMALLGREVRPGIERPAVGSAEDRHRPTAGAGESLGGRHVDGIEIWPLLPVDLDRHEPLGQIRCRGRVFEALVRHDVAPVARGIPDRKKDRLVLLLGPVATPPRPRGTTRPGCPRAGAGRGWSRRPGGSPQRC